MSYRVITVSGEVASGKSTVANELLNLLPGWKWVNTGQRFREYCTSKGMTIQQVAQLPDEVHIEFDRHQTTLLQTEANAIVEGRLAGWLARNLEDVYKVFCYADLETRVERYMSRDDASRQQAIRDIEYRDVKDIAKFQSIYAIADYRHPGFYNLMLDTSTLPPLALAKIILKDARLE